LRRKGRYLSLKNFGGGKIEIGLKKRGSKFSEGSLYTSVHGCGIFSLAGSQDFRESKYYNQIEWKVNPTHSRFRETGEGEEMVLEKGMHGKKD